MEDRDFKVEFETIIREIVKPVFQRFGFKKSGNNFYREINEIGQAFNVQQSQWNSKDDKTFVFNLGLIDEDIYVALHKNGFPKFPKEYHCGIRVRLGELMDKNDIWYDLNQRTVLEKLKEQINTDLDSYVVTFFEAFSDPLKWLDLLDGKFSVHTSPIWKFLIIEKYGQRDKAEDFLNKIYNDALIPKTSVSETLLRDRGIIKTMSGPTVNKEWIKSLEEFANSKDIVLKISTQ